MQAKLDSLPFEMRKKHQNHAGQTSLPNIAQNPIYLRFNFSTRIRGIVLIFCITEILEESDHLG